MKFDRKYFLTGLMWLCTLKLLSQKRILTKAGMEGNTMKDTEGKMEEKSITEKNMHVENTDVEKKQEKKEIVNKTSEELLIYK